MAGLGEGEVVKEEEEEMEEDGGERTELRAITEEEQRALAKNLQALGKDKWKILAKRLGNEADEVWNITSLVVNKYQAAVIAYWRELLYQGHNK